MGDDDVLSNEGKEVRVRWAGGLDAEGKKGFRNRDVQWAGKSCLSGCSEAVSGVGDDDDA